MDENADGGVVTSVATENATSVTVTGGDDKFEVADGNLKLKAGESLDFESDTSPIELTITASGEGESATHTVTVSINDVNEAPTITVADGTTPDGMAATSTVAENTMGALLGEITLSDVDAGQTHTLTTSDPNFVTKQDDAGGWWLALADDASLNFEDGAEVMVTVTVTDDGDPAMSAEAVVTITVTDENDDPMFAQSEYAFDLNENDDGSTTPVSVGMVEATDEDSADMHTFSITAGNDAGLFAIDDTGAITYVGTGEDYRSSVTGPSHTLTVEVSDGTSSAEATVAITILNVNEAPMFGDASYEFDLAENADGSTTAVDVGMVSASDSDEGDSVTYSITAGNDDSLFAIDADTGAITYVGSGEDAETTASHELTVSASDGVASSEAMVMVTVTNANDSTPMFGEDTYAFDLAENADGSATAVDVGMVSATDSDGDTLEYSITAGNDGGLFAIDSASGAITYVGMGENHESDTTSHELTVQASDGSNMDSATVTVSVTDLNDAPSADAEMTIAPLALVNGAANEMEVNLGELFSDEDGDTLTYSLSGAPDWLNLAVTTSSDGSVTGRIHGTPPDDGNNSETMVKIVATDADGATGEAMFYVVVDAANADPSSVTLRQTSDGVTSVVTAVTIDENAMGAGFGMVTVEDVDNAMHPHGQHTFTFEVDGEASDKFEVADGMLKLKDDQELNFEDYTDGEFTLTVTATDKYVMAPGEDEEDPRGSASMTLEITVKNTADGPVAGKIGDWWVTVDDRLDAEDAREGEWLSFGLKTTGEDAAFTDEDSDTLTYSLGDGSPDWLQINAKTGAMTNKEGMVPERGVYTVTVTATDEDDNSASASFKLAVAVADLDGSDNDRPDIREVNDYDYMEGSGGGKVVSFEVRDDDIAIDPHPYGTLEVDFTATQNGNSVKDRFKLVPTGDNGDDTATYEIHHKSADELFVMEKKDGKDTYKLDKDGNKIPIEPIDYENGDEVEFSITATDGEGEEDDQTVRVDIEDDADASPVFDATGTGGKRKVDPKTEVGTTTFTVDQQETAKEVIVLHLSDVWSDPDTDVDELDFTVGGRDALPDWVKVYGPDEWEDIRDRRDDVDRGDAPTGLRDRDLAIAIVIDRTAATGDNESEGMDLAGFTLTAEDPDGNDTTENISISVTDTNVDITVDAKNPVLSIVGDANGTGSLTMDFDAAQDPDLSSADDATLVLYTWSIPARADDPATTGVDETAPAVEMVSTSPQPFVLDANRDMANDYIGRQVTATVKYYEVDPANGQIVASDEYTAMTKTIRAPEPGEGSGVAASFDITTTTVGLTVDVALVNGDITNTAITARLESSTDGQGGWQRAGADVAGVLAFTGTTGTATVALPVDEDDDGTTGDGGGLYYRVVLTYGTGADQTTHTSSDMIQLGDVTTDPTGAGTPTDIIGVDPSASPVDQATVGETIRVNTDGDPANVQWQVSNTRGGYDDIEGATGHSLTVTSAYAGKNLRAKVTYTDVDDPTTPTDDETGWVTWVEYTEVGAVPGGTNGAPAATQILSNVKEIEVELPAMKKVGTGDDAMDVQPGKTQMGTAADLFHDPDDDALTYSIAIPSGSNPDPSSTGYTVAALDTSAAGNSGSREEVLGGNLVYVTYETESVANPDTAVGGFISQDVGEPQQTLAIDKNTGEITYFTNMSHGHDGNDADGQGNILTFTVSATDNVTGNATAEASVAVRINVAPTAINLQSSDGTTDFGTAADLPAPSANPAMPEMGTALLVADGDGDGNPDMLTYTDDARNSAVKLANLNVQDENATDHDFGTHTFTLSGRGSNMFEIKETRTADTDGSTWELYLKEGATFDFEALQSAKEKAANATEITLSITVTATDGGNLKTMGVFSVKVMDADTEDDPETPERPTPPPAEEPETPGLKDDSDDSDEDGAVLPEEDEEGPGDGGMFIDDLIGDDLLGDYVLTIDDIDIA